MTQNPISFYKPNQEQAPLPSDDPLIKIRGSLKKHLYLAGAIFIFCLIASISILVWRGRVYTVEAIVEVSPRLAQITNPDANTPFSSMTMYQEFLRQQIIVIGQPELLNEALKNMGEKRYLWQGRNEENNRAAERLAGALTVDPILDSYSFYIRLDGPKPEGLSDVVNAIVSTYIEKAENEQVFGGDARYKRAKQYQQDLIMDIQRKSEELNGISQHLGPQVYQAIFDAGMMSELNKEKAKLMERRDELASQLEQMGIENPSRQENEDALRRIEESIRKTTPAPPYVNNRALLLKEQVKNDQDKLVEVNDFLAPFTLSSSRGLIRPVTFARYPEGGRFKKSYLFYLFVMTVLLTIGVPYLIDHNKIWIYNARDLEEMVGFPTLCWLPDERDRHSSTLFNEQIKRIAFSIDRAHRQNGFNVFLLTSVIPQSGTTSLTFNLAYELTKLGMKAIAVEANPIGHDKRYPDYSADNPGLISMISRTKALGNGRPNTPASEDKTDHALIETANGRGWLPSVGQSSEAFKELKSLYDIVLLDAPPILACSETEHMVSIADATLLIIMARKTSKKQIKHTLARLERLSPASLGTIVSGVSAQDQPLIPTAAQ